MFCVAHRRLFYAKYFFHFFSIYQVISNLILKRFMSYIYLEKIFKRHKIHSILNIMMFTCHKSDEFNFGRNYHFLN